MTDFYEETITMDGLHWHVVTAGDESNPPLLLLHCWTGNWRMWQRTMELLSPHFYCIAPDQLGFGESDKPSGDYYRIPDQARRARDILAHYDIERATVVGHSMGGQIALTLAALDPQRVERLIVVDPPISGRLHWRLLTLTPLLELVGSGIEAPLQRVIERGTGRPELVAPLMTVFFARPFEHLADVAYWSKQIIADGQIRSSYWAYRAIRAWDLRPHLRRIHAPLLAIWGTRDWTVDLHECATLEAGVRGCHVVRITDCGHFPMIEAWDRYAHEIRRFLGVG